MKISKSKIILFRDGDKINSQGALTPAIIMDLLQMIAKNSKMQKEKREFILLESIPVAFSWVLFMEPGIAELEQQNK